MEMIIQIEQEDDFVTYDDIPRIFKTFSLVNWFTRSYNLRVLDKLVDKASGLEKTVFSFEVDDHIVQVLNVYEVERNSEAMTIRYSFQESGAAFEGGNIVDVVFVEARGNKCVYIKVEDVDRFIEKRFAKRHPKMLWRRSQPKLKSNELKYPYIEPETERNVSFDKPHFSLAFQGGGAKGLAYIGAYKSLIEAHPDIDIKSVIGSSAGGIVALAISVGLSVEEMVAMMSELKLVAQDKVTKSTADLTEQKLKRNKNIVSHLREVFHQYGLIYRDLFDSLVQDVLTDDLIEAIFDLLCDSNPSLREMFSMDVEEKHPVILNYIKNTKKLTNYFGLLDVRILKGEIIENIALRIVQDFIFRKLKENRELVIRVTQSTPETTHNQDTQIVNQLAKTLTMKQLYFLTGVELTCTAVDLQDKIIRFFNHKTTPNMPVYKAVEITGSFPVVFEAQRWQKEWGYYYIHHIERRVELDLTGHRFTDGGVLANFPIKYLDNEKMRTKYFSHQKNDQTKLFGFGLHYVNAEEDSRMPENYQGMGDKVKKIIDLIINNFPKRKFLLLQTLRRPSDTMVDLSELPSLREIPLVQFLLSLLETYQSSNDNLVRECFRFQSYIFDQQFNLGEDLNDETAEMILKKYRTLGDIFSKLKGALETGPYSVVEFDKRLEEYKEKLRGEDVRTDDIFEITDFLKRFLVNYGKFHQEKEHLIAKLIAKDQEMHQFVDLTLKTNYQVLDALQELNLQSFFLKSHNNSRDASSLISQLLKISMTRMISLPENSRIQDKVTNYFNAFLSEVREIEEYQITNIVKMTGECISFMLNLQATSKDEREDTQESSSRDVTAIGHQNKIYHKLFRYIMDFVDGFSDRFLPDFIDFKEKVKALEIHHLSIEMSLEKAEDYMLHYIHNIMQRRTQGKKDVHLVFQGLGNSCGYYFHAYNLVNQYITTKESRKQRALYEKLSEIIINTQEAQTDFSSLNTQEKQQLIRTLVANIDNILATNSVSVRGRKFVISQAIHVQIVTELERRRANTKRVSAITCSNLHSFLGFLICAGFSGNRIQQEVNTLKYMTKLNQNIEKRYNDKDWINPTNYKMRRLQDELWAERYNIFEQLEKAAKDDMTLLRRLDEIKYQFNESKERVVNGFEEVMDYLINIEISRPDAENAAEYFSQKLLLKTKSHDYYKEAKKVTNGAQQLIFSMIELFEDQIHMLMLSMSSTTNPFTERLKREKDPKISRLLWKGYLIDVFLDASAMKKKIHQLLEELHLPKEITIKEFYEVAPIKIDLNFIAVDLKSQRICFINRHTYPSMAIWAAILISGSYPPLFQKIRSKPEWLENVHQSFHDKATHEIFKDTHKMDHRVPVFVSGNLLASFPLEILYNHQVQRRYLKNDTYIFLNFGINLKQDVVKTEQKVKRSFISIWDISSLLTKVISIYLTGSKLTPSLDFLALNNKLKILTTYVNSNDNLILDLYRHNLLLLPIRFNTLDFHKLGDPRLIALTLEETSLMTTQKLSQHRITFFKIDVTQDRVVVFFVSRDLNNQDTMSRYNLFYAEASKKNQAPFYIPVKKEIILPRSAPFVYLRFQFAETTARIKESTYKLSFEGLANKYREISSIYSFRFDSVINELKKPLLVNSKSLSFPSILKDTSPPTTPSLSTPSSLPSTTSEPLTQTTHPTLSNHLSDDPRIKMTSLISIEKDGLYCQRCCCTLAPDSYLPASYSLIFKTKMVKMECYHCKEHRMIRFICPDCNANYCTLCTGSLVLKQLNDQMRFVCFRGHHLHLMDKSTADVQSKGHTFTICDCCRMYVEEYYEDTECNMHICYSCASTIAS